MVRRKIALGLALIQFALPALAQIKSVRSMNKPPAPAPAPAANPNILFEGYSKILIGGVHTGYTILRYEFDPKKKLFLATYLVKAGNILESLKAVSDQNMGPISYEYTSLVDKKVKTIDAKFSGGKMTATIKDGGVKKTSITDIPKNTFIGIFLFYVILRNPKGLQTETSYDYKAIAEEDAKIYDGTVSIGKEEKFNGIRSFSGTNTFKKIPYTFYLTDTGEVLMTDTPSSGVKTTLVAKPEEAVGSFSLPLSVVNSVFGETPAGLSNRVSKIQQAEAKTAAEPPPTATKRSGIPPDPKVMLKNSPQEKTSTPGPQDDSDKH